MGLWKISSLLFFCGFALVAPAAEAWEILVLDADNSSLVGIDPTTGGQRRIARGGALGQGQAIAVDGHRIYVLTFASDENLAADIVLIDRRTGNESPVTEGDLLVGPRDIAVEADGRLVVAAIGDNQGEPGRLVRVDPVNGQQTPLVSAFGFFPTAIAVDSAGVIWVADVAAPFSLVAVDPLSGARTPVATGGFLTNRTCGLAVEASDDLLITSRQVARVSRVFATTGSQSSVSSGGQFVDPIRLAVEPTGDIVVVDFDTRTVYRTDPMSGAQSILAQRGFLVRPLDVEVFPFLFTDGFESGDFRAWSGR